MDKLGEFLKDLEYNDDANKNEPRENGSIAVKNIVYLSFVWISTGDFNNSFIIAYFRNILQTFNRKSEACYRNGQHKFNEEYQVEDIIEPTVFKQDECFNNWVVQNLIF